MYIPTATVYIKGVYKYADGGYYDGEYKAYLQPPSPPPAVTHKDDSKHIHTPIAIAAPSSSMITDKTRRPANGGVEVDVGMGVVDGKRHGIGHRKWSDGSEYYG